MNTPRRIIPITIVTTLMVGASLLSYATAADTQNINATVTLQNISITIDNNSIDYGTVAASGTEDTTTNGVNDSVTITNASNVAVDVDISGDDTTPGNWVINASTNGVDQYVHKFCTATCDSSPTWTGFATSNVALATGIASSGTQAFDLQITMPSSSTDFTAQTVPVTLVASLN